MRVLVIHNFYQQFGGEDAAHLADLDLLAMRGVDVVRYERHNDEIKAFDWKQKAGFVASTIASTRTTDDIARLVASKRPDVAYIHNVYPLISPSVYHALHAHGIPMVQVMHDFRPLCSNGWYYTHGHVCEKCAAGSVLNAVWNRCYRDSYALSALYAATTSGARRSGVLDKITAFICPTEFMQQKLGEVGVHAARTYIKPHCVDAGPIPPRPGAGDYALYLGRLSAEKGVRTLLDAARATPGIPLHIAGAGPLQSEIAQFVESHSLSHVVCHGFVSGAEKQELLANARFIVVPSECYETFGMVVLEAYAHGKPVIASRIGSLPFVVEEGRSGTLFEAGNAAELASRLQDLFHNTERCRIMGTHGRRLVETRFCREENATALVRIFSAVMSIGHQP